MRHFRVETFLSCGVSLAPRIRYNWTSATKTSKELNELWAGSFTADIAECLTDIGSGCTSFCFSSLFFFLFCRRKQVQNPHVDMDTYHNNCSVNPNLVRGIKLYCTKLYTVYFREPTIYIQVSQHIIFSLKIKEFCHWWSLIRLRFFNVILCFGHATLKCSWSWSAPHFNLLTGEFPKCLGNFWNALVSVKFPKCLF